MDKLSRCPWANTSRLVLEYHDHEWGVPLHDDRMFFELLTLEGAQAGLSWITVLGKRAGYREAFDNFDPAIVATYNDQKLAELRVNPGIIRNRLKIGTTVQNAQAFLAVQDAFGSFDAYIWQFVGGVPRRNAWLTHQSIPASTQESVAMSNDLKRRGFFFVGATICYAFMQASGMVNDHLVSCFRYEQVSSFQ